MYAVIKTGGKQYRVSPGDKLKVEKLEAEAGADVVFEQVLLIGGAEAVQVGSPTVANAKVTAKVQEHGRANKVITYKYKRRKGYHKKQGHRQDYTLVLIQDVVTA